MIKIVVFVGRTKFKPLAIAPIMKETIAVCFLPKCFTNVGINKMATTDAQIMTPFTMGCKEMFPKLY